MCFLATVLVQRILMGIWGDDDGDGVTIQGVIERCRSAGNGVGFTGSSLFQMGEYFEILAARVDPGRIRKR
jgi:hypothetical protein